MNTRTSTVTAIATTILMTMSILTSTLMNMVRGIIMAKDTNGPILILIPIHTLTRTGKQNTNTRMKEMPGG
jgi:hypothetical protein